MVLSTGAELRYPGGRRADTSELDATWPPQSMNPFDVVQEALRWAARAGDAARSKNRANFDETFIPKHYHKPRNLPMAPKGGVIG